MHAEMPLLMDANELLEKVKSDKTSGASELMKKAIHCLRISSENFEDVDPQAYYDNMLDIGRQLIDAQPSMASLFGAVNTVLLEIERGLENQKDVSELKADLRSVTEQLIANSEKAMKEIQKNAADILENGQRILTHSYSSTVVNSLIFASDEGKEIEVIVTESRPLFEGRKTAKILRDRGIKVILIADMASYHFLDEVDLILTGSDCICHNGVVNKIGTKGLAMASWHYDIPFYVLSEKGKFLPKRYMEEPKIEERDPEEVSEDIEGIVVRNIYFDITPFKFFRGIITGDGMASVDEVKATLANLEVFRGLTGS